MAHGLQRRQQARHLGLLGLQAGCKRLFADRRAAHTLAHGLKPGLKGAGCLG